MSNRGREPVLSRLVVPQDAIQHIDDKPVAFVEEQPGTYEKRTVTLGSEDEPYVEILDGLKDGERVVTLRIVLSQVYHAGRIAWRAFAPPHCSLASAQDNSLRHQVKEHKHSYILISGRS